jgi:hypothetical protein
MTRKQKKAAGRDGRLDLLRKELHLAGINLRSFLPRWGRPPGIRDVILNELLVTLEAPIHEGQIPPYGSIVVGRERQFEKMIPLRPDELELARKAADGSSGLLVFYPQKLAGLLLLDPAAAPELQLAELTRHTDGIAFRRDRFGVVRVYGSGGGLRHVGRRWDTSPALADAFAKVHRSAPMVEWSVLADILRFAYFVLSPWYIGATLVWVLSSADPFTQMGVDLRPLRLSVAPTGAEPSIAFAAHLLAQFDGATILAPDGRILRTGVQLSASEKAKEFIAPLPGTRHTSAQRASYDFANTIIVTVSADGPVTIFSDGLSIFKLWWFSADDAADGIHKAHGAAVKDAVWASADTVTCERCGKTSSVEILTRAGWRENEQANCQVCKERIAEARCFMMHANVVKVF